MTIEAVQAQMMLSPLMGGLGSNAGAPSNFKAIFGAALQDGFPSSTSMTVINATNSAVKKASVSDAEKPSVTQVKDQSLREFNKKAVLKTSGADQAAPASPPDTSQSLNAAPPFPLSFAPTSILPPPTPSAMTPAVSSSPGAAPALPIAGDATPSPAFAGLETPPPVTIDPSLAGTPSFDHVLPEFSVNTPTLPIMAPASVNSSSLAALAPTSEPTSTEASSPLEMMPSKSLALVAKQDTAPTDPSGKATVSTPLDQPGWAEAIGQHTLTVLTRGLSSASIHITPEHLGSIQVTLDLKHDQAQAVFVSPHEAVRQAIEVSLPVLRDMFSQAGLNLGQASVNAQNRESSAPSTPPSGRRSALQEGGASDSLHTIGESVSETRVIRGLLDTYA